MKDGVAVHLWLFTHVRSKMKKTLMFFHGNAGNMSFRLENFKALFHRCDVNVLAVEYRGYGLSEGTPGEEKLKSDAVEVLHWLHALPEIDNTEIYVLGRSLGGAVAFHMAADNQDKVAGIIVENTFTSTNDIVDVLLPKLSYFKWLSYNVWANIDVVPKLRIPCLFLRSGKDELIPKDHMERLVAAYGGNKELVHFPDAQHMNANTFPGYDGAISRFLNTIKQRRL